MKLNKTLFLFIFLISMTSAFATTTDWKELFGDYTHEKLIGTGNYLTTSERYSDLGGGNYVAESPIIANLDSDLDKEIFIYSNTNLAVANSFYVYSSNLSLDYSISDFGGYGSSGNSRNNYVAYDMDSDGIDEIIVINRFTGTSSKVYVYKYNSTLDQLKIKTIYSLATSIAESPPICKDGYCYFQDNTNKVFRFNPSANTMTALTVGSSGTAQDYFKVPLIADCTSTISGNEVAFIGDFDGDDEIDDFALIPENDFQNSQVHVYSTNHSTGNDIYNTVSCGTVSGQERIGVTFGEFNSYFNVGYINSSDRFQIVHQQKYAKASASSSESTSQVIFYDVNNDANNDYCLNFVDWDGSADKVKFLCFNSAKQTIENSSSATLTGSMGSMELQVYIRTHSYKLDFDDDGKYEFLYSNQLYNPDTNSFDTIVANVRQRNYAFTHDGGDCLSLYYIVGGDSTNRGKVYNQYSTSSQCGTVQLSGNYSLVETFGNSAFDIHEDDCLTGLSAYDHNDFVSTGNPSISADNEWHCWKNQSGILALNYTDSSDTNSISTPKGLFSDQWDDLNAMDSLVWVENDITPNGFTIQNDNNIAFTCDASDMGTDNDVFLVLESSKIGLERSAFSFKSGGCSAHAVDIPALDSCCDLSEMGITDCSAGKTNILFTPQDAIDNCADIFGELSFTDLTRVELFRIREGGQIPTYYFDDLYIENTTQPAGNQLPFIIFNDAIPNPQNISDAVSWSVSIGDNEDLSSAIWSAFDCNVNSGGLDYGWSKRGFGYSFSCTYNSAGNYTSKAFATDDSHYPSQNDSMTGTVEIYLLTVPNEVPQGNNCTGFVAPSCANTDIFCDTFAYNKPIMCNNWTGTANHVIPIINQIKLFNMNVVEGYDFQKIFSPRISELQYQDITLQFDFSVNTTGVHSIYLYDLTTASYPLYLAVNNYQLSAYSGTAPYSQLLQAMTPSQVYSYKGIVKFGSKQIDHYIDSVYVLSTGFYDIGATGVSYFSFGYPTPNNQDLTFDNFRMIKGNVQPEFNNETIVTTTSTYTYNPDLFCAINWTAGRSSRQNCIDRGFETDDPRYALCVPSACVQDTASMIFNWFLGNIFLAIVVVVVLILIIPLLISMRK